MCGLLENELLCQVSERYEDFSQLLFALVWWATREGLLARTENLCDEHLALLLVEFGRGKLSFETRTPAPPRPQDRPASSGESQSQSDGVPADATADATLEGYLDLPPLAEFTDGFLGIKVRSFNNCS